MPVLGLYAIGDHSEPPFAPGSMRTPFAVGGENMFSCGTNAWERRTGVPSVASITYTHPVLPAWPSSLRPLRTKRTGGLTASRSQTSCGTVWRYHLSLPVVTPTATTASQYRLSPGRTLPVRSGEGFPIVAYSVLVSGSYAGVIHVEPPPCRHALA